MALTRFIVAYDISDDDARAKVAARLLHHGVRQQQSVFACDLEGDTVEQALDNLAKLIDEGSDTLQAFRQCPTCAGSVYARGQVVEPLDALYWIV
jgi:CRISPR-associated endonuclease Cas2